MSKVNCSRQSYKIQNSCIEKNGESWEKTCCQGIRLENWRRYWNRGYPNGLRSDVVWMSWKTRIRPSSRTIYKWERKKIIISEGNSVVFFCRTVRRMRQKPVALQPPDPMMMNVLRWMEKICKNVWCSWKRRQAAPIPYILRSLHSSTGAGPPLLHLFFFFCSFVWSS